MDHLDKANGRMHAFLTFVFSPAGLGDASLAIAATRAGAIGIYDAELDAGLGSARGQLDRMARFAGGPWGIRLPRGAVAEGGLDPLVDRGLTWVVVGADLQMAEIPPLASLRARGVKVLVEVTGAPPLPEPLSGLADGVIVKGNESGGFVGEEASFILVQKWLRAGRVPAYLRGGLTPHVAAAGAALGLRGGVLDSQLLLLDEVRLVEPLRTMIGNLAGSETVAAGNGETGEYYRLLVRPSLAGARRFVEQADALSADGLRPLVAGSTHWRDPVRALLPIGQDVAFAAAWRKRHQDLRGVLAAFDAELSRPGRLQGGARPLTENAPLARSLGLRYPIVQGPMTRVSDTAEFALAVAEGGGLPMLAFAMLKGQPLRDLLERTHTLLGDRPWGIGLLGFAPQELLDEQLAIASAYKPAHAIIAGGRPDQAVQLERAGVPTFLHVPAASLITTFLQDGARRFIFEGRECGGHIGPLSSFVLWSTMVDRLLDELGPGKIPAGEVELLFAGGVHDALSSAMLQVLVAPLAEAGAKVGVLMGSAYLFTREIVDSGAIVPQFQQEVIECTHTVNLESGPGHASRCAYTPFAQDFFGERARLKRESVPPDEARRALDDLILGRLRTASKGSKREGLGGELRRLEPAQQRAEGMYMLGQVATLRAEVTDIATLHAAVTTGAAALLREPRQGGAAVPSRRQPAPADVAIIGIGAVMPQAGDARQFWENIVAKVDAITEIPAHRWDWRLYFDADRKAADKVYSKWGGFLDDLPFDPTRFGMPPKSIEAVDPMQLMGLEVARRTLDDAGYATRPFDGERASVILGASGGAGDFGMQYGLRAELPRFSGNLPTEVAARLPEWTEDSFAGILPNVAAGRIANRLNFGGMNLTTDAACASSLAAVYLGVTELMAGRSDLVIAGGIDTVQGPFGYLCFSKTQALSPRGRCFTFDAAGDGIAISEGIAMVALKRLADAERDGDRIYAVIKGVGSSSDGKAKGLTAPLPAGQLRAMRRAYEMAGFGPSTVGLFEAHGTGTVAGDTAELESTTRLIAEEGALARQAVIGSVKTNVGHTKASAGVAGMVKAAIALQRRVLPPHRNVTVPNAVLADPGAPLYLTAEPLPWLPRPGLARRAACSAFGFGGTNFHVVMEEYQGEYRDWLRPAASEAWSAELLMLSAPDRQALARLADALGADLPDAALLRDVAASLWSRWHAGGQVLAVVARHVGEAKARLVAAANWLRSDKATPPAGVFHGERRHAGSKLAVLFPGQGSQYPGMGREVALHHPEAAATLARADEALAAEFSRRFGEGEPLSRFIHPRGAYGEEAAAAARQALTRTDVAQPALGAVEVGLHRVLCSLGLAADMFAGHSYGELVALHAAGVCGFDDLMALSAARGRFIVDAAQALGAELGTMAAVSAARKDVEDAIADLDDVIIANHNAPRQCIVSGTAQGVDRATRRLREAGAEVSPIPVAAAFHSSLVRPAQEALAGMIDSQSWVSPAVPVYSNTTARVHPADVQRLKRQMADHLVRPVEFVAQIEAMHGDGARIFVEVGPKSVLSRLTSRILEGRDHVAVAMDDGAGMSAWLAGLGQLLCAGVDLDLGALYSGRDCRTGDPARPASLVRERALSPHAWMLNGSGARRADQPPRQIGVTLEQARTAVPPPSAVAIPVTPTSQVGLQSLPTPDAGPQPVPRPLASLRPAVTVQSKSNRSRSMEDRRPPHLPADGSVMAEYFATMRQFLETQERVMASYLGDAAPVRSLPRARTLPVAAPRLAELPPPTRTAAPPVVQAVEPAAAPEPAPPSAAPAVAPAKAPAAMPAVAATAPQKPAAEAPAGLTRDKLLDMLLTIVEEKTGYPRDMVGLTQNLESDLGIDSIKRIEVVGALLQQLPGAHRDALTESRSKLNTQQTLEGMLNLVAEVNVGGAVAVPFDSAGAGSEVVVDDHPPRLVMRPRAQPVEPHARRSLTAGRFVLTRDDLGVAEALAVLLRAKGHAVDLLDAQELCDEQRLLERARSMRSDGPLAGLVHLLPLSAAALDPGGSAEAWRAELLRVEKSLFLLLREWSDRLAENAHVVSVSGLGGLFGRESSARPGLYLGTGAVGGLKSLLEERPALRVKAIDHDPQRPADTVAAELLAELEVAGGRQELGFPAGVRTAFVSSAEPADVDPARLNSLAHAVVLATGGARGITAEVLRELARPGVVLALTGRSPLPETENPDTAGLRDAVALRQHFVGQVRAGQSRATPAEIGRRVQGVLDQREMRANLADFRQAGAVVEYHAVDVTDETAVAGLVKGLLERHGRITGVVHGAGVIEDKRLADKSSDSWSRVVDTKVLGLLLLQKHVPAAALEFFTVFSSVAGRYGNSGQSDYATANELMNRLCIGLQARWGGQVAVSALCWGPWGATRHGAGMVTPETEAKFAAKGVSLVTAELGRALFRDELLRRAGTPTEVICGRAPWEPLEAARGVFDLAPQPAADAGPSAPSVAASGPAPLGPLLQQAKVSHRPTGERVVDFHLDGRLHLYLQEHVIDGRMVLPAAAALEMMAEAVQALWPGWTLVEASEHKLLKGVEVDALGRDLSLLLAPPPYGSSEGFEVSASLQSTMGPGRVLTHYRCVLRLEQAFGVGLAHRPLPLEAATLTAEKAYGEWLFHGPRLQLIDRFEGLSAAGATAEVRSSRPDQWLAIAPREARWAFDPGLLDVAAQVAWLWSRNHRGESALPARFGRVRRYRAEMPERLRMSYQRIETDDPTRIRGHVQFTDADGLPVLDIEELDSIASAALNRLGGTAQRAVDAPA